MKHKIISLIMSAGLVFSMASCGSPSGETPSVSTNYKGLHFTGINALYTATEDVDFQIPLPTLKNEDEETVDLEYTYSVYDSNYGGVGKTNGCINVKAGVYQVKYTLKSMEYNCDSAETMIRVFSQKETVLEDFNSSTSYTIKNQPTNNFGTNRGSCTWMDSYANLQGVLSLAAGSGADGTRYGDRDGVTIVFDDEIKLSDIECMRLLVRVEGNTQMRFICGFVDGDWYSGEKWYQQGKYSWQLIELSSDWITSSTWSTSTGDSTGYITGVYIRSFCANASEKIYVDYVSYVSK